MLVSTRALAPVGGQLGNAAPVAQNLVDEEYAVATGADAVRKAVRQAFFDGADLVKVIVGFGPRMFTVDELKAIVEEAHQTGFGQRGAAHAIDEISISRALEAGVDSIEHGYGLTSDKLIHQMAEKRVFMVATEEDPATMSHQLATESAVRLKRILDAGVPIAFGSDAYYTIEGLSRGRASLRTLHAYRAAGFTPWQILQAATINASELLGLSSEIGAIETGKLADIVAAPGDVLADPSRLDRISFVMKAGKVVVEPSDGERSGGGVMK